MVEEEEDESDLSDFIDNEGEDEVDNHQFAEVIKNISGGAYQHNAKIRYAKYNDYSSSDDMEANFD